MPSPSGSLIVEATSMGRWHRWGVSIKLAMPSDLTCAVGLNSPDSSRYAAKASFGGVWLSRFSRKENLERRAFIRPCLYDDLAAALPDDSVYGRQPESGSFSRFLSGE